MGQFLRKEGHLLPIPIIFCIYVIAVAAVQRPENTSGLPVHQISNSSLIIKHDSSSQKCTTSGTESRRLLFGQSAELRADCTLPPWGQHLLSENLQAV